MVGMHKGEIRSIIIFDYEVHKVQGSSAEVIEKNEQLNLLSLDQVYVEQPHKDNDQLPTKVFDEVAFYGVKEAIKD